MNNGAYTGLLNMFTKDKQKAEILTRVREGDIPKSVFEEELRKDANQYFPTEDADELVKTICDNVLGYNVLTDILYDETVSDVKVHDWNHIVIKRKGTHELVTETSFASPEDHARFIDGVITRNRVNASTQNAIQRFTDRTSIDGYVLRFTLLTPFITTNRNYYLVIRKVKLDFPELDDLIEEEMLTREMVDYLENCWSRGSVLICGANASGKTTLLNALKEKIPPTSSVLVIQQAEELTTKTHPDMMFLHSFEGVGENAVRYDLRDLSIAGLTLDVDVFIIGEIKGAEALYLLNASYTGSTCGGTIHSNDSQSALDKIVDYAFYNNSTYTKQELMLMLLSFKTIVYVENYKVKEISEVMGIENGKVLYREVYKEN